MTHPRTTGFDPDTVALADLARALAHPGRIRILQILCQRRRCLCGEIVAELPLAQATVSQHLKELKNVGLIRGEIEGPRTCYCIDPETVARSRAAFLRLFATFDCCGEEPR